VEQVEMQAAARQEQLENALHGYKTNLIKESIRMGHNDLGDFHFNRGDLQASRAAPPAAPGMLSLWRGGG
jgi:COP9 signalosome complex subunit 1